MEDKDEIEKVDNDTVDEVSSKIFEEEEVPGIETPEDLANVIVALVFASPDVLTVRKIRTLIGEEVDASMVNKCLQIANEKLIKLNFPFEVVPQAGGFVFRTKRQYYPWVRRLFPEASARRLSQASLETLAIIAYKQPITRAQIDEIRAVQSSDGPIRSLLEKKLIAFGARLDDVVGRPYTYVTTNEFLKYFGINSIIDDLPRLEDLNDILHAGELVPQFRGGELKREYADDFDPDQVELPMDEG